MNIFLALPTDPQTWTVGFFGPDGQWQPESDHGSDEAAARRRAAWLNGAVEQRQRLLASVPSVPVNTEMRTWLVK